MTRATPAKVILGIAHRRDPGSSFGIADLQSSASCAQSLRFVTGMTEKAWTASKHYFFVCRYLDVVLMSGAILTAPPPFGQSFSERRFSPMLFRNQDSTF